MSDFDPHAPQGARTASAKRALVVANEAVSGDELRDALLAYLGASAERVFVVAPAIIDSALKHTMGDVDEAIEPARERLRETLEALRDGGLDADGEVGDSDPIQAIHDEVVKFDPEQILVVGHRDEEGASAEQGLLEQAERDFDLPVVEIFVKRETDPAVLDVKSSQPGAGRKKGWRLSGNWPPLSRRDVAGILVAIIGTLVLGVLAAECIGDATGQHDLEEGRLEWPCAASALIALGMALINLAHVVGLLLFQSVRYEGIFSRFFARMSLYGTPIAIAAVLLLQVVK